MIKGVFLYTRALGVNQRYTTTGLSARFARGGNDQFPMNTVVKQLTIHQKWMIAPGHLLV
jgi:hypothetical protein